MSGICLLIVFLNGVNTLCPTFSIFLYFYISQSSWMRKVIYKGGLVHTVPSIPVSLDAADGLLPGVLPGDTSTSLVTVGYVVK